MNSAANIFLYLLVTARRSERRGSNLANIPTYVDNDVHVANDWAPSWDDVALHDYTCTTVYANDSKINNVRPKMIVELDWPTAYEERTSRPWSWTPWRKPIDLVFIRYMSRSWRFGKGHALNNCPRIHGLRARVSKSERMDGERGPSPGRSPSSFNSGTADPLPKNSFAIEGPR